MTTAAICGGVSANHYLRHRFYEETVKFGLKAVFPKSALCTDNGAMIAGMAQMRYNNNCLSKETEVSPSLSWEKKLKEKFKVPL